LKDTRSFYLRFCQAVLYETVDPHFTFPPTSVRQRSFVISRSNRWTGYSMRYS